MSKKLIIVWRDKSDNGWHANCPSIPEISGQGSTKDKAKRSIEIAIALYEKKRLEDAEKIPKVD